MPLFRRKQPEGVPPDPTLGDPRAARIAEAVEKHDLDALRAVLTEPASVPERERLFGIAPDLQGHVELFDEWVEREPDDPTALLARGAYRIRWAWDARGGGRADTVGEDDWDVFFERLNLAEDDLERAAALAPDDAVPHSQLMISARGLQIPKEEAWLRYEEVQRRHPWLVGAHEQFLQYLAKKWFGSHAESLEYARKVDQEAPDGAAVRSVVALAHVEIWFDMDPEDGEDPEAYERDTAVRDEIRAAAERSVLADGFTDDLTTIPAVNAFAFALWLFRDEATAATLVKRLGPRRTDFPWFYLGDGDQIYGALLES